MNTATPAKPGRPRLPIAMLRVKVGNHRVKQTTKAMIDAHDKPGHWLDAVVEESARKTQMLTRVLPFLDNLSAQGDDNAAALGDEIRRLKS